MKLTPPLAPSDLEHLLERTERLWDDVRGRRIFVTGGTGFFGCWLLESFLAANRAFDLDAGIVVLTRSPAAFRNKCPHLTHEAALELVTGDVRDFTFPPGDFHSVIHAATETVSSDGPRIFTTIVHGTERCLEFAQACGASEFLLTSSGAVYGKQPAGVTHVTEEYLGAPDSMDLNAAYGEGKRAAETLCAIYGERAALKCKIARCFAFVGPHLPLDAHFAIGNFIRDAIAGVPIHISGDGTPQRSYLYASDLAVWLWTILFRGSALRAYNVGSEQSVSILDLARETCAALRPQLEIHVAKQPVAGAPILRYVPATARAREELGLEQRIGLREAIGRTAKWYGWQGCPGEVP
jgi:nucleoside-diphosphate-sugar epimerase